MFSSLLSIKLSIKLERIGSFDNFNRRFSIAMEIKNRHLLIIGVGVGIIFIVIIIIIISGYFLFSSDGTTSNSNTEEIGKARRKCQEYTELACSLKSKSSDIKDLSRIVHGNKVPPGMLPHQALLRFHFKINPSLGKQCGGTLISEKFVLTAAQCVNETDHDDGKVLLGSLDMDEKNNALWKKVKKVHVHPEYAGVPRESDICLLELEEKVEFNSDVRPICLNTKLEKYDSMIASGWGLTEAGNPSKYLHMVELRIDEKVEEFCRTELQLEKVNYGDFKNKGICAAHLTQGINQGDAGGPLQVKLDSKCENTWEQIGISILFTGENYDTSKGTTKQFFTKVEYYVPWIESIVWPN